MELRKKHLLKKIFINIYKKGKIKIPNINYNYSLKQNIENINFEKIKNIY